MSMLMLVVVMALKILAASPTRSGTPTTVIFASLGSCAGRHLQHFLVELICGIRRAVPHDAPVGGLVATGKPIQAAETFRPGRPRIFRDWLRIFSSFGPDFYQRHGV